MNIQLNNAKTKDLSARKSINSDLLYCAVQLILLPSCGAPCRLLPSRRIWLCPHSKFASMLPRPSWSLLYWQHLIIAWQMVNVRNICRASNHATWICYQDLRPLVYPKENVCSPCSFWRILVFICPLSYCCLLRLATTRVNNELTGLNDARYGCLDLLLLVKFFGNVPTLTLCTIFRIWIQLIIVHSVEKTIATQSESAATRSSQCSSSISECTNALSVR